MRKIIFIIFLFPSLLFGQNIDSLKLALKIAKHDTTRCIILNAMIEAEADDNIWPQYNEQLKQFAEKNISNNSEPKNFFLKHLAAALNNIGYFADQNGDIPKALDYFHKSLKIKEKIGDKEGIAESLNNIGVIYGDLGDISKSLDYYHKSLKIQEEIGDKSGIANSLNNIGLIYKNQREIPRALECFHKSLKILEAIGYKVGIAGALNNIGGICYGQGDIDKALDYFHKSLKIKEEIGYKVGAAGSLNNIGGIYKDQGDISKALEYYYRSLKIREEIRDKQGIAESLNNIAVLFLRKRQMKEAMVFAGKGMQVAKELGFPESIKSSANTLKTIFLKQNKYKEAFEMYELEVKMRDSINNEETQKAAVKKQMQYQYETAAKELQNEQDKKDLLAKEELKQKEKERNYFIIGFALVIVLVGFIFRGYRQKQKANILITQQKKEVEESKKEILDSIHYAKRIQKAHLPSETYISKAMSRLNKRNSYKA